MKFHYQYKDKIRTRRKAKRKAHWTAERKEIKWLKKQLINRDGNICQICGKEILNMKDCTIDHIIPISKGGLTELNNCQLAHMKCNLDKGNTIPFQSSPDDSGDTL